MQITGQEVAKMTNEAHGRPGSHKFPPMIDIESIEGEIIASGMRVEAGDKFQLDFLEFKEGKVATITFKYWKTATIFRLVFNPDSSGIGGTFSLSIV